MRLIDADALLDDVFERYCKECDKRKGIKNGKYRIVYNVGDAPCRACSVDDMKDDIENAPTIEERKGEWLEKHHAYSDEESGIEEWQSCKCSKCGRYDTRPYMYYFQEPKYCSWCGADMRGEEEK